MTRKETSWLVSVIMSVVMLVTLLASPAATFAGSKELADTSIKYINSDGEEINAKETSDGLVYTKVNSDGELVVKVLGYRGKGTKIQVPSEIDGIPVVSFAIDPRWPVVDEMYDSITSISLPNTIECAHATYMEFFRGLKSVDIASGNEKYRSEAGVLYKADGSNYRVAIYPFAKTDKTYVFPSYVTNMYGFFDGCPIESITISKSMKPFYATFDMLSNLKEIKVASGNPDYYANDGVLFQIFTDEEDDEIVTDHSLERYPVKKTGSTYTIPSNCNYIQDDAFDGNEYLKEVIFTKEMLYVCYDSLSGAENLSEVEFKMTNAPSAAHYYRYSGIRHLYEELEDDLKITYPKSGKGWNDFLAWIKGKEQNYWDDDPWLDHSEVPLGSNMCPIKGYPEYGDAYPVYSKTAGGNYTTSRPTTVGKWYVKLLVDETSGHTGLESEAMEFEIVDVGELPADNYWIVWPYTNDPVVGEDIDITAVPLFGEVDKVEFRASGSTKWTTTVPTKPGIYAYRLIVNGTTKYEGLEYISDEDDCWLTIYKRAYEIGVHCEDIALGDTPKPELYEVEWEDYTGCTLSYKDIKFRYERYIYDPVEDDEYYVEVDPAKITETDEYRVTAYVESDEEVVEGSCYFNVMTKVELAESKINDVRNLHILSYEDKESVDAAVKAYNRLSPAEKEELGERYKSMLDKAVARMDSLVAIENLETALDDYIDAKDEYDELLAQANKSKAAADKAAKTPGLAAVKATEKAQKDAEALAKAAAAMKKAAEKVETLSKTAATATQNDPALTRLEKQNFVRYQDTAAQQKNDAAKAVTAAASKVKAAKAAASSAQAKYGKAAKKYKVSGLKAKALKKKKAKITWKANKNATGYQIQYSLKKNMKKAKKLTIKKGTIKKATLKKLKAKKKYYVRIRTISKYTDAKTGKAKTVYGKWSAKKTFKAKK